MADPITALGAAAGAVQLADIALRASREVYGYLSAIKDANKDVERLTDALRETDTTVRNLRNYVDAFSRSRNARDEFEVLSENITGSISCFQEDIRILRNILPESLSTSLAQKIRWVHNKQKVKEITKRLQDRRVDVTLALTITGRVHDLRLREDTGNLGSMLESTNTAVSRDLLRVQNSLDAVNSGVLDIASTTTVTASNLDIQPKFLRAELQSTLRPVVEQAVSKSEARNEAMLRSLGEAIDSMSLGLGHHVTRSSTVDMHDNSLNPHPVVPKCDALSTPCVCRNLVIGQANQDDHTYPLSAQGEVISKRPARAICMFRDYWPIWKLGSIEVRVDKWFERCRQSGIYHSHFTILVTFRPSSYFCGIPGISLSHTTAPNKGGFYQLAPMIATFPIVSDEHEIWDHVEVGDLAKVQWMISTGSISPRCELPDGLNLLMWAALYKRFEICKYLLGLGVDPFRETIEGFNTLFVLLFSAFIFPFHDLSTELSYGTSMESIRFAEQLGLDWDSESIDKVWEACLDIESKFERCAGIPNLNNFRELIDYFVQRGRDPFEVVFSIWPNNWKFPCSRGARYVQSLLDAGLDPNFVATRSTYSRPLLIRALDGVCRVKKWIAEVGNQAAATGEPDPEYDFTGATIPQWCILELLTKYGADVYYLCDEDNYYENPLTPTDYAIEWDVEEEWCEALQACGYDPDVVYEKSGKLQKDRVKLHGANRTGVDVEDLKSPSEMGLRWRRPRCVEDD